MGITFIDIYQQKPSPNDLHMNHLRCIKNALAAYVCIYKQIIQNKIKKNWKNE